MKIGTIDIQEHRRGKVCNLKADGKKGHRNRFIAHRRLRKHVVRVIYEYDASMPVVITVYYPLAARYFKGRRDL